MWKNSTVVYAAHSVMIVFAVCNARVSVAASWCVPMPDLCCSFICGVFPSTLNAKIHESLGSYCLISAFVVHSAFSLKEKRKCGSFLLYV